MKKLLLIILLFVFAYPAYSETKITISGKAEVGSDVNSYNTFSTFGLGLNFYTWKFRSTLYGSYRTWMVTDWTNAHFYPYRDIYTIGGEVALAGFFINVQHFCNHPVKSNAIHTDVYGFENKEWRSNFYGESITTISIGYSFEFPIWTKGKE